MTTAGDPIVFIVDDDDRMREAFGELLASHGMNWEGVRIGGRLYRCRKVGGSDLPHSRVWATGHQRPPAAAADRDRGSPINHSHHRHGDTTSSVLAIKHGAVDLLTKPFSGVDFLTVIDTTNAQDREKRLGCAEFGALKQRHFELTPPEREVLPLVVSDLLNKQAVAQLGIFEVTLQIHRRNVMRKMAAASPADLVRIAERVEIPIAHSRRAGRS